MVEKKKKPTTIKKLLIVKLVVRENIFPSCSRQFAFGKYQIANKAGGHQ